MAFLRAPCKIMAFAEMTTATAKFDETAPGLFLQSCVLGQPLTVMFEDFYFSP